VGKKPLTPSFLKEILKPVYRKSDKFFILFGLTHESHSTTNNCSSAAAASFKYGVKICFEDLTALPLKKTFCKRILSLKTYTRKFYITNVLSLFKGEIFKTAIQVRLEVHYIVV
jgi:hypothetical protein